MAETVDTGIGGAERESLRRSIASRRSVLWLRIKKNKLALAISVILAAAALPPLAVQNIPFLLYVEYFARDLRTTVNVAPEPQDQNIVIVGLDEDTLKRFPYAEPVDRAFLAHLINRVAARGARAIGLDILLDQPTEPEKTTCSVEPSMA